MPVGHPSSQWFNILAAIAARSPSNRKSHQLRLIDLGRVAEFLDAPYPRAYHLVFVEDTALDSVPISVPARCSSRTSGNDVAHESHKIGCHDDAPRMLTRWMVYRIVMIDLNIGPHTVARLVQHVF